MKPRFRVAAVQCSAGSDLGRNLKKIQRHLDKALAFKPHIIALPENFLWRGPSSGLFAAAEETEGLIRFFKDLARRSKTALLLGSLIEPSSAGKYFNTSVFISPRGRELGRYRKIHLFDVRLPGGRESRESRHIRPGRRLVRADLKGIRWGLSICYDLRFPEMYRALSRQGCRAVFVPANFTRETGRAHWEILLRARAIENQMFVIAPAQTGIHPGNGIPSHGHSLILDPWGRILAEASGGREEVIAADLDLPVQQRLRKIFPVLQHCALRAR